MIKKLINVFWFIGSIYFAIFLITFTTLLVIIGTFIEALYDSHLYASYWTYDSPMLSSLFAFFFLNILISALRRWPFKWKHVPFLITHLGLLMIITGCMIKQWYGLQGHMFITEGNSSTTVQIPYTYGLQIEKKIDPLQKLIAQQNLFIKDKTTYTVSDFPELQLKLLHFIPHTQSNIETWIKGDYAFFYGVPPIKVQDWNQKENSIQFQPITFVEDEKNPWHISAIRTENISEAILATYKEFFTATVTHKVNQESIKFNFKNFDFPQSFPLSNGTAQLNFELAFSEENFFPSFILNWYSNHSHSEEKSLFPLHGINSLEPILISNNSSILKSQFDIDFTTETPIILLIDNSKGILFFTFDKIGRIDYEFFPKTSPKSIISYDNGFGGYTIQKQFPLPPFSFSRDEIKIAKKNQLIKEIRFAIKSNENLTPPLKLLKQVCEKEKIDFSKTFVELLYTWDQGFYFLSSQKSELPTELSSIISKIDWKSIPNSDLNAIHWITLLFSRLEIAWRQGLDLINYLKTNRWPFINELEEQSKKKDFDLLNELAKQMFRFSSHLPDLNLKEISIKESESLFKVYLKAFGLDYQTLIKELNNKSEVFQNVFNTKIHNPIRFETPLTIKHLPIPPLFKIENNCPCIMIEAKKNKIKQIISLPYDSSMTGLKWPILDGEYLLRFQPKIVDIPFRIRLRQARQIPYIGSNQIFSYESDIAILENGKNQIEKTLSMNHVYETWNGYRFYLSSITTLESGLKRVQLAVNYDPAKYIFTYPGGLLVALGIILLFWFKPYSKKIHNHPR